MLADPHAPISLAAAGRLDAVRVDGQPASPATVSRWASRGRRARDGRRVRLATRLIGGKTATTAADVEAFLGALNREPADAAATSHHHVDAELRSLGIA